jgi:hypothetical protein
MTSICDCSVTDYDPPSVYQATWRTARQVHSCGECGAEIVPGIRYEYVSGCWEGTWNYHRTCAPCVAIRDHYCPRGFLFGTLVSTLFDCLGFDYREVPDDDDD